MATEEQYRRAIADVRGGAPTQESLELTTRIADNVRTGSSLVQSAQDALKSCVNK